jgi:CHAD domain-containing protein
MPLGRATKTLPKQLRSLVRAHLLDRPTVHVATLRTHRTEHHLLDAEGQLLATVADDRVSGWVGGEEATVAGWREWEVELGEGQADLLEAAEQLLLDAGATPAAGPNKLSRVLGDRLATPGRVVAPEPSVTGPASDVLLARLVTQVEAMKAQDPDVRRDVEDAVHQMRVAMRRMRSALATYRPLVERTVTDPVRDELKWLGQVLGQARDTEVIHAQLRALLEEEPVELVIGPVANRIDTTLGRTYREAHDRSLEALDSERYVALVRSLDRLLADPPWTELAAEPAADVLPILVRKDFKRLRKRVDAAHEAADSLTRNARLHEARKAAKRARYAAEALVPVYGGQAEDFVSGMKKVQTLLGDHHDAVVIQDLLRQLGIQAYLDGENAFSYGRLHALEQARAAENEQLFEQAWRDASSKTLRRWLR